MFVKYKINPYTLPTGTTATTINIPINLDFSLADNSELVQTEFVTKEVAKSINPILDYEKTRYIPVGLNNSVVQKITYNLSFINNGSIKTPSTYADIGFYDEDIKFKTAAFKNSFLQLSFYDSNNLMEQNLITQIDIYNLLNENDTYKAGSNSNGIYIIAGQPKPASQIPVSFELSNPITVRKGNYEGFYLYDYKDDVTLLQNKDLYMKATYFNARTGKVSNMMVTQIPQTIENLVNNLHTRYILYRTKDGFYYKMDTLANNVVIGTDNLVINLYEVQTK